MRDCIRRRRLTTAAIATLVAAMSAAGLTACADDAPLAGQDRPFATATVNNADGGDVGSVSFTKRGRKTEVSVEVRGLEPGFRGFHVHEVGSCEPVSAAGGHLQGVGDAPGHGGDLPPLLVGGDGKARMTLTTDRLSKDELVDGDGSAVIIGSEPAGNGSDETTLTTGDTGGQTVCGVVGQPG